VEELKKEGYTIKAACEALGIARSSYYASRKKQTTEKAERKVKEKDAEIIEKIKEIKTLHPFWVYRRKLLAEAPGKLYIPAYSDS